MKETPKNIRQIGGMDPDHKIYVEDYVVTYTRTLGDMLLKENKEGYKAAILLGMKERNGREMRTYVSGMVCIDGFSLSGEAAFSNELWSGIYDKIKAYYEEEEIVGWMFMGCMEELEEDARLINVHSSNFTGKNMIFIRYNCEEREEKIYDYLNNGFILRKGYYVYYEKNKTMQNYMLADKEEETGEPEYESDNLVRGMRDVINRRSEQQENRKLVRSIYATGMLVAAVALLIGSTAIYNMNNNETGVISSDVNENEVKSVFNNNEVSGAAYDFMHKESVDESLRDAANVVETMSAAASASMAQSDVVEPVSPKPENSKSGNPGSGTPEPENHGSGVAEPVIPGTGAGQSGADRAAEEKTAETMTGPHSFYIVKSGDSLGSIAESIYNSVSYVDDLMEANNISDADKIYEGQKLWLPDKGIRKE